MGNCDLGALFFLHRTAETSCNRFNRRTMKRATGATSYAAGIMHELFPNLTIAQLREKCEYDRDLIEVIDWYIENGEGDVIPQWS